MRFLRWIGYGLLILVALPLLLLGAVISPLAHLHASLLQRLGLLPEHRTVEVDFEGYLSFNFAGNRDSTKAALGQAFELLVELLPSLGLVDTVTSLEIENPESGFCVEPEKLQRMTRNFGDGARVMLWREMLEYGKLRVNDELVLDLDRLDFRSPLSCEMLVLLPESAADEAERLLVELAPRFGFVHSQTVAP